MSLAPPNSSPDAQSKRRSLPPEYFEDLYAADPDPWQFETSAYEAKKYAATLAALPKPQYRSAFEIGGSIGVLSAQLAQRCQSLLSVDVCAQAQAHAKKRCRHLPQVEFEIMQVPHQYPNRTFDLTLVSEVGYYWGRDDLLKAQQQIASHLEPGGHLLLVHWTPLTRTYPLTGDQVHAAFWAQVGTTFRSLVSQREQRYRLDLFERL
ncbi:MAG: methyltransferase domain-containing protein [Leptolyngbyaceae cyanobacterium SM1_1_3]|nr:methyltransferase domain-containing protein [Leptolyngbyaceae cyanobacterium SM1_1_3]NJN02633.1 methyltransferase domain-containing protein [Leptolyngbyaceae cyanobacterium RM1_1_2]NJO09962.1 methyltransferase domain-containing protein [Leptolyngbyaceae cyanobacterium SL_1_1]